VSPSPADVFPLGFLALQSDGLGESQLKNLLGLIEAAQLKMSERLQESVTPPAASANRDENKICCLRGSQSFSIRTTSLTAGPITVKSSRSTAPARTRTNADT